VHCFEAGATATGCRHEIALGVRYLDLRQNPVLAEDMAQTAQRCYDIPSYWTLQPAPASTDFGNVSHGKPRSPQPKEKQREPLVLIDHNRDNKHYLIISTFLPESKSKSNDIQHHSITRATPDLHHPNTRQRKEPHTRLRARRTHRRRPRRGPPHRGAARAHGLPRARRQRVLHAGTRGIPPGSGW